MPQSTSTKQLVANRENAKLGGVKTAKGKAISKLNATKHGLLSKEVLLAGEDEQSLVELGKRMRDYIKPIGELELILTERAISNIWRLKRILKVERSSMEWHRQHELKDLHFGADAVVDQVERKAEVEIVVNQDIETIIRYETAIERSLYKALHELQRIQSARAGEKPLSPLAIDLDVAT